MNAYPTKRFQLKEGWVFEVIPLTFARARIVHTDGVVNIMEFW